MNEVALSTAVLWIVLSVGLVSGALSFWLFRRAADPAKLRIAVNRILAHLFELRLFADEPILVIRSQRDLFSANFAFLRLTAVPSLLLLVPFAILIAAMEGVFAYAPIPVGTPAVVTMQCRAAASAPLPQVHLVAPRGIRMDTPPLRFPASSQIAWRVIPLRAAAGELELLCDHQIIRKSIASGSGPRWISTIREGSLLPFLLHPFERPFASSVASAVSITYPPATVLHASWLTWFLFASFGGAVLSAFAVRP